MTAADATPAFPDPAKVLKLQVRRSRRQLHADLLRALLETAGLDRERYLRMVQEIPDYGDHTAALVKRWLNGDAVPCSPYPLLAALREAGLRAPAETGELLAAWARTW